MRLGFLFVGLLMVPLTGCFGTNDTPRDDVRIDLQPLVAGLDDPVFVTHAGDGSGRLFIVEQGGTIRVWKDTLRTAPFLDVSARISTGGERGLLGLAFHPDYASNGRFFVYYTATGGDVTLAEHRNTNPADDAADAGSGKVLLTIEHSQHSNHNGGMLAFGPDGMLYMAVGDGGSANDPDNNAQDLESLLGKILRLDVDRDCGDPVCRPADNPFVGTAGRDEIWLYGLRNPWRFSFDRGSPEGEGRGDLWIGDVGQGAVEEVDLIPAGEGGANLGWSRFEGTLVKHPDRMAPDAVPPVAQYTNEDPHCAITGGYVYRGNGIPDLVGSYLFGDFCSGTMWTLRRDGDDWVRRQTLETELFVSSFGEDEDGELWVVDHAGAVHRVVAG